MTDAMIKGRGRGSGRTFLIAAAAVVGAFGGGQLVGAAAPAWATAAPLPAVAEPLSPIVAPPAPVTIAATPATTPAASTPRAWDYALLPLVYYQPETSWGAVGQVVLVRKASSSGNASEERHDTVYLSFTATWRRQYALSVGGTKFWNEDRDRLKVDVIAQRFPSTFWGLGNNTPSDAADQYTPLTAGTQTNYSHRVFERVFAGVSALVGYYRLQTFEPGGAVADFLASRRRQGMLVGLGPNLVRDSRDDSNYPRSGSLTTVTFIAYLPAWFSDYRFVELDMDQRTFVSLPWSSVLALQAYGQMISGEAPIELLPALGGPMALRGYFQGRYRDKVYTVAQAEWRVPLFWRLGAAIFGAVGDVFPDLAHLETAHLKESAGVGLRLNVGGANPMNLRLDGALSRDSAGVYLMIGEAI